MNEKNCQIVGLLGFIIAGLIFIVIGVRAGDTLTILASIIWTLSCVVWMLPFIFSQQAVAAGREKVENDG